MPYLELNGERHALPSEETVVGSGAKATLRLPNVDLAGRHFSVMVAPDGKGRLESCSPHHVVIVNGQQLTTEAVPLAEGDVIAAGSATFLYCEDATRAVEPRYRAAAPAAYLVNQQGRKAYALGRRAASIGRDPASHIHIAEPTISRFHADIRSEAGQYVLYSLGSAGTQVNGERVAVPRMLTEGDRIEFGDTSLVFTRKSPQADMEVSQGDDAQNSVASGRPTVAHTRVQEVNEKVTRGVSGLVIAAGVIAVIVVLVLIFR